MELFIQEVLEAIDDTAAAINTGSLYSRSGRLLSSFPDQAEYHLPEFKQAFSRITERLTGLKRKVTEFEETFRRLYPNYSHHQNFYAMIMSLTQPEDFYRLIGVVPPGVQLSSETAGTLVGLMDSIDGERNAILDELNVLLSKCGEKTFDTIKLSSAILKERRIGGADHVAPLLR